ncbi:hypothetical protein Dimus_012534 [Dionaea muscipula]
MNGWAPGSLFISKTLVVFNLWGSVASLRIPSSVWLSSLKILHLTEIPLLDSSFMTRLFNGCPLLQDLSLESCRWVAGQVYIIPAPMLRCLRIETAVDVLYNPTPMPKVEFIVPRLKCFEFYGEVLELYCIKSATALAIANITVCDRIGWNSVLSLIGGLSNATTLKFSNMIHDVVPDYVEDYHFHSLPKLPIFGNLLELKGFWYCYENLTEFVQSPIHINMLTKPQESEMTANEKVDVPTSRQKIVDTGRTANFTISSLLDLFSSNHTVIAIYSSLSEEPFTSISLRDGGNNIVDVGDPLIRLS